MEQSANTTNENLKIPELWDFFTANKDIVKRRSDTLANDALSFERKLVAVFNRFDLFGQLDKSDAVCETKFFQRLGKHQIAPNSRGKYACYSYYLSSYLFSINKCEKDKIQSACVEEINNFLSQTNSDTLTIDPIDQSDLTMINSNIESLAFLLFVSFCFSMVFEGRRENQLRDIVELFINTWRNPSTFMKLGLIDALDVYSNRVSELRNKKFSDVYIDCDNKSVITEIENNLNRRENNNYSYLIVGPAQSGKSMLIQKLTLDLVNACINDDTTQVILLNSRILNNLNYAEVRTSTDKKSFVLSAFVSAFKSNELKFKGLFGYSCGKANEIEYLDFIKFEKAIHYILIVDAIDELRPDVRGYVLDSIGEVLRDGGIKCDVVASTRLLSENTMKLIKRSFGIDEANNLFSLNSFSREAREFLAKKICPKECGGKMREINENEYLRELISNPLLLTKYLMSSSITPFDLIKYVLRVGGLDFKDNDSPELRDFLGKKAGELFLNGHDTFSIDEFDYVKEEDLIKTGVVVPAENNDSGVFAFINHYFAGFVYFMVKKGRGLPAFDDLNILYRSKLLISYMVPETFDSFCGGLNFYNQCVIVSWACDKGEMKLIKSIVAGTYSPNLFSSNTCKNDLVRVVKEHYWETLEPCHDQTR